MVDYSKVVALVNPKSGERASAAFLYGELERLLDGRVVDLSTQFQDQTQAIQLIETHAVGGVVLVAGGDGTVSFGMDILDKINWARYGGEEQRPYITVIPMGTGNDLSRSLGHGPGFAQGSCCCKVHTIDATVSACVNGSKGVMDRWSLDFYRGVDSQVKSDQQPFIKKTMNNYFSIGFDAHIAKKFDRLRKAHPSMFKYRIMNKGWYGLLGARAMCGSPVLTKTVELKVDGKLITIPDGTKALVLSNIDSYAGGSQLWKDKHGRFKPLKVDDQLLEVSVMFGSTHAGMMQAKMRSAEKVAQGLHVTLTVKQEHYMQWDGEALEMSEPCTIVVTHHSSPKVVHHRGGF